MKPNILFFTGVVIDAFVLLIAATNLAMMNNAVQSSDGTIITPEGGLTGIGRLALWLIPLVLLGLILAGFWLKSSGKMLWANILVWLPALPMLGALLIGGGLAVLFIFFGK